MMGKTKKQKMQTSETFLLSAILAVSGGFQDAYTYNVRGEVFSNAQTGNVVLMSQHFLMGDWYKALHYLFPIVAFAFGVLVAEQIGHKYKYAKLSTGVRSFVVIEMTLLFVVGFIPAKYNMAANMIVSFACSMQVQTFRKVHGYGYASTMCIGNLRSGTESLSVYLRDHQKGALKKAAHYYGIILIFALGCRIWRYLLPALGHESHLGIQCAFAWYLPYDGKGTSIKILNICSKCVIIHKTKKLGHLL